MGPGSRKAPQPPVPARPLTVAQAQPRAARSPPPAVAGGAAPPPPPRARGSQGKRGASLWPGSSRHSALRRLSCRGADWGGRGFNLQDLRIWFYPPASSFLLGREGSASRFPRASGALPADLQRWRRAGGRCRAMLCGACPRCWRRRRRQRPGRAGRARWAGGSAGSSLPARSLTRLLSALRVEQERRAKAARLRRVQRLVEPPGPPERKLSRAAMEQMR